QLDIATLGRPIPPSAPILAPTVRFQAGDRIAERNGRSAARHCPPASRPRPPSVGRSPPATERLDGPQDSGRDREPPLLAVELRRPVAQPRLVVESRLAFERPATGIGRSPRVV